MDRTGKIVIEPQFKLADYFSEGLGRSPDGYISLDLFIQK